MSLQTDNILAYDGVCGLCHSMVRFVARVDRQNRISFVRQESEEFTSLFSQMEPDLNSVMYLKDHKIYRKSTAILQVFRTLGGFWRLFLILYLIPPFIRDFVYQIIAKNRYRVFGKSNACALDHKDKINQSSL